MVSLREEFTSPSKVMFKVTSIGNAWRVELPDNVLQSLQSLNRSRRSSGIQDKPQPLDNYPELIGISLKGRFIRFLIKKYGNFHRV